MGIGEPLRLEDPSQLGEYRLLRRLGHGGMGVVYLAEGRTGVRVALKVIHPHFASDEDFRQRFRSEVALARKVARFSTAPILDSDTDADPPYIVTEFIDGPTLSAVVAEQGPLSGSQLHALGVGMASALTAIHGAGIVHRDLKPANVLLSRFGPRVIDFGIARAADAVTGVTRTGQYIGSPSYMAPEQFRGEPITPAADIFAWGAVMAFAGTGRQPFGKSAEAVLYRVVYGDADVEGLDPQLAQVVVRSLSKHPAERLTAQQLLDALVHDQPGGRQAAQLWSPPAGPNQPASFPGLNQPASLAGPNQPAPPASGPNRPMPPPVGPSQGAPPTSAPPMSVPPAPALPMYGQPAPARPMSGPPVHTPPPHVRPVMAPAPRQRRRSTFGIVAGTILACLLACGGCGGALAYLGFQLDRGDSITALETYLDTVKSGDFAGSYDQLCDDAKIGVDRDTYVRELKKRPRLTSFRIDEQSLDFRLGDGFDVDAELSFANGQRRTVTYLVVNGGGDQYSICPPD